MSVPYAGIFLGAMTLVGLLRNAIRSHERTESARLDREVVRADQTKQAMTPSSGGWLEYLAAAKKEAEYMRQNTSQATDAAINQIALASLDGGVSDRPPVNDALSDVYAVSSTDEPVDDEVNALLNDTELDVGAEQ